jgi:hypothetical protein
MSQDMSATFEGFNATVTPPDDRDPNTQLGSSTFVSISQSTVPASTPSAFAISGGTQQSSERTGTPGSPPGTGELIQHLQSLLSRPSVTTELEGTTPPIFDGTGGEAPRWFNRVELYFIVNEDSSVAKDPLRKIGLTLCWIRGPRVDYWVDKQIKRLMDQVPGRNAVADPWTKFREDFLQNFTHALLEVQRAYNNLDKLEMKDQDIDEYIETFGNLADLAQVRLDCPSTLKMFRQGLPRPFVLQCLESGRWPKTFAEWCELARRNQYANEFLPKLPNRQTTSMDNDNDDERTFGTHEYGNSQQVQVGFADPRSLEDISVNRRAVTEDDKAKYRAKGLCFRCGEQRHLSRNCPS